MNDDCMLGKSDELFGVKNMCCCVCENQIEIRTNYPEDKHVGWGCIGIYRADGDNGVCRFFKEKHGICELFQKKRKSINERTRSN